MPVVILIDWLLVPPRHRLTVRNVLSWMAIPVAYLAYTLIRGAVTGWYPYPFIDAKANGYPAAILVGIVLAGCVGIIGTLLIKAANARTKGAATSKAR